MQREPAVRNSCGHRRAVFLITATGLSELRVNDANRQATGMIGLDRVRQLKQLFLCGLGRRERAILVEFHCWLFPLIAESMAGTVLVLAAGPRDRRWRRFSACCWKGGAVGEQLPPTAHAAIYRQGDGRDGTIFEPQF